MRRLKRPVSKQGVSHAVGSDRIPRLVQAGLDAIRAGSAIRVPVETDREGKTRDFNNGGNCAGYAVRVAKIIFDLDYERGHAWDLAKKNGNVLVQRFASQMQNSRKRHGADLKEIGQHLLPGMLVGIYFPWSVNNKPDRPYTHIALYLGFFEGKHWIMHNVHGPRFDSLEGITTKRLFRGTIVDIIQPAKK